MAAGKHEVRERLELGDQGFEAGGRAGCRYDTAEIEEARLRAREQCEEPFVLYLCERDAERAVQFIDVAEHREDRVGLVVPTAIGEAALSCVAGFGRDARESPAHGWVSSAAARVRSFRRFVAP